MPAATEQHPYVRSLWEGGAKLCFIPLAPSSLISGLVMLLLICIVHSCWLYMYVHSSGYYRTSIYRVIVRKSKRAAELPNGAQKKLDDAVLLGSLDWSFFYLTCTFSV